MKRIMIKQFLIGVCVLTLVACGGGGGSSAPVADSGPPPSGQPVPPTGPVVPDTPAPDYATAKNLIATITNVTVGTPSTSVDFMVTNEFGVAIQDLTSSNVRFTFAKLIPGTGGSASAWQSYINRLKTPAVYPANPAGIQATSERGGTLANYGDGTYTYSSVTDITNVTSPMAVTYEADLTHRVAIQFSGGVPVNPVYDWVPATGATSGIESREIVSIESCNSCHDPLALHGGGRVDTKLCVTCHNPGSTEPNSLNTVDFKVMIHKIHSGKNLPSVVAGGSYLIYGYRDSLHDYSELAYPQDIRNCTKCHAGTGTGSAGDILTTNGDNWNEVPTQAACGSCHDDVDFALHMGGQTDDSNCSLCHSEGGFKGSVANSHRNLIIESMAEFNVNVLNVTNTAQGQFPLVNFSVTNPLAADAQYDILTAPEFTGARFAMGVAWSTSDYNNIGNGGTNAAYQTTNVLTNAVAVGDGTFNLTSLTAVPDGTLAPFIPATGSGAIIFEGRAKKDISLTITPNIQNIPLTFAIDYFSIDEAGGVAVPRRQSVSIDKCNSCHEVKVNHGGNRANDTQGCVGCHNPRNTDKVVRLIAASPPTDGKDEESIDFKSLIHGLHAAAYRQNPLQIVGYGGFSTHVFDETEVHFPGDLSNCRSCHLEGAWRLPLADSVLASTIDTGVDIADPGDDLMVTPTAAVCSSCHDTALAKGHIEQNGGDFAATMASIAGGASTEVCSICHGSGRVADLDVMHGLD